MGKAWGQTIFCLSVEILESILQKAGFLFLTNLESAKTWELCVTLFWMEEESVRAKDQTQMIKIVSLFLLSQRDILTKR